MAVPIFMIRATIAPEREDAFNRWYDNEHCPQVLALYEFESQETLESFLESDHSAGLSDEYDRNFGEVSERVRDTYVQVWP